MNFCRFCQNELGNKVHLDVIVPIYKAKELISSLLEYVESLDRNIQGGINLIIVSDGEKPEVIDDLKLELIKKNYSSTIIKLSRNFGVMSAIRAGLAEANHCVSLVFGADLQEPVDLFYTFFDELQDEKIDIVLGVRNSRKDSMIVRVTSAIYWTIYKFFSPNSFTSGGYDVFAINNKLINHLLKFDEYGNNLTSQIDQIGFGRKYIRFDRQQRLIGKSTWSFRKRIILAINSFYNYTTIPILFVILTQMTVFIPLLSNVLKSEKYAEIIFYLFILNINLLILTYYLFLIHRNSSKGLSKNYIVERTIKIKE
jgi:hypothetical protein